MFSSPFADASTSLPGLGNQFKGLNNQFPGLGNLIKGFGQDPQGSGQNALLAPLKDAFEFNPGSNNRALYNRSHFTLQAESTKAMQTETGFAYKHQSVSIEVMHERFDLREKTAELAEQRMQEYFSPEETSQRIYNMATSFFPRYAEQHGLEDTPEGRQAYSDFISPFIDKGFEQALDVLGDIPDEVSSELNETINLVHEKMAGFVSGDELGYHQQIYAELGEKFKSLDTDEDGGLSQEESGFDGEQFQDIDTDGDGLISLQNVADYISEADVNKDLDQVLLDNALNPGADLDALAQQAKDFLSPSNRITMETLRVNITVTETIVQYSENPDEDFPSFAKFLDGDEAAQDQVNEQPESIHDILKDFKIDTVLNRILDRAESLLERFNKDFFKENDEKLDFMYDNPLMAEFFGQNEDSAKGFLS